MKAWVKTLLVSHIITQKAGEKKMVKVWAARITPLFDKTNYAFYYEKLPEWRKEKADRLKSESAKAQSVGAWSLWTRLQQQEKLGEDTPFNLSHSGEYVLCAFSDCKEAQVGCDLEMIGEYREKVAKRFFCGVQWHPEWLGEQPGGLALFRAFLETK